MLIGAKKLTMADDAFTARQMHAAMDAAHHVFACRAIDLPVALDAVAISRDKAVNKPDAKSKKYQFDQHRRPRICEALQKKTWE